MFVSEVASRKNLVHQLPAVSGVAVVILESQLGSNTINKGRLMFSSLHNVDDLVKDTFFYIHIHRDQNTVRITSY